MVEQLTLNQLVLGSSPSRGTNFAKENDELETAPQVSPNILGQLEGESEQDVKFPKRLRHNGKGRVLATIYKRPGGYRIYWRARGADGRPRSMIKECVSYAARQGRGGRRQAQSPRPSRLPERQAVVQANADDPGGRLPRVCRSVQAAGRGVGPGGGSGLR